MAEDLSTFGRVRALHVIRTNWPNDDIVLVKDLERDGLQITLDGSPSQQLPEIDTLQSVNSATFVVTLETPLYETPLSQLADLNASPPRNVTVLNGDIKVANNTILWKPKTGELVNLLNGPPSLRILRVTLKGHMIWTVKQGEVLYLDGQAFGRRDLRSGKNPTPRTSLILPSGAGAPASDFESWLFVPARIAPPPFDLALFTMTPPTSVRAGELVELQATASSAAPREGLNVTLTKIVSSAKDPVPDLPTTRMLNIPEGEIRKSLKVQTKTDVAGSVLITAKLGQVDKQVLLITQVVSVTISPSARSLFRETATASRRTSKARTTSRSLLQRLGGTITQVTPTEAIYRAPLGAGTFKVKATSNADPSKYAEATVQVRRKDKDSKDSPDGGGGGGGKGSIPEQIVGAQERRFVGPPNSADEVSDDLREQYALVAEDRQAIGQTFIRPEERPPVGGLKIAAKKKRRPSPTESGNHNRSGALT